MPSRHCRQSANVVVVHSVRFLPSCHLISFAAVDTVVAADIPPSSARLPIMAPSSLPIAASPWVSSPRKILKYTRATKRSLCWAVHPLVGRGFSENIICVANLAYAVSISPGWQGHEASFKSKHENSPLQADAPPSSF